MSTVFDPRVVQEFVQEQIEAAFPGGDRDLLDYSALRPPEILAQAQAEGPFARHCDQFEAILAANEISEHVNLDNLDDPQNQTRLLDINPARGADENRYQLGRTGDGIVVISTNPVSGDRLVIKIDGTDPFGSNLLGGLGTSILNGDTDRRGTIDSVTGYLSGASVGSDYPLTDTTTTDKATEILNTAYTLTGANTPPSLGQF
jgi:hypothetical protein